MEVNIIEIRDLVANSSSLCEASGNILNKHGNVPLNSLQEPTNQLIRQAKLALPNNDVVQSLPEFKNGEQADTYAADINATTKIIYELAIGIEVSYLNEQEASKPEGSWVESIER